MWSVTFQVADAKTGDAIEGAEVSEVIGPGPPFAAGSTDISGSCVLQFSDSTPNSPSEVTVQCSCDGYASTSTQFSVSEYEDHGGPPVPLFLLPVIVPDGAWSAVGDPAAYMFDAEGTQHIAFRGSDNHLYEFWWSAASGWLRTNLTTDAAGAPIAVGDPAGYLFAAQNTQHVIYRAADHHIHELWWDANGWHHHDPTGDNDAPNAAGDPAGYVVDTERTQHIVYRSDDQHIYELLWTSDAGWSHNDLTMAAGAPNAVGDPVGYLFAAQNTQHVIYRAADHHIHELWKDASGWHHHDPTGDNGAPDAVSDPAGYVFAAQGTQHIIYRRKDGHLMELSWIDGNWSHKDVTVEALQNS